MKLKNIEADRHRELANFWRGPIMKSGTDPVTESVYLDDVAKLLLAEMLNGVDNGDMILDMLRGGAEDYLRLCEEADRERRGVSYEDESPHMQRSEWDEEKRLDDRDRARDMNKTMRGY
jgi:hypothetical protein